MLTPHAPYAPTLPFSCRSLRWIAAGVLALILASPGQLRAELPRDGQKGSPDSGAIMREFEEGIRGHPRVVRMQVVTHYGDPDPVARTLWGVFNGNPDQTRILYVFTAPDRVRGASLLIHDDRSPTTDDPIWLYLPNFESVLRLQGRGPSLLIPGTALSYEDARGFIPADLYEFALAPAASHPQTGAGLRLLARPKTPEIRENVGYESLAIQFDEVARLITRIDYTDRIGRALKSYEVLEPLRFAGRWFPKRVRIEHFELGWVTEIEYDYRELKPPVDERLFEASSDDTAFLSRLSRLLDSEGIPSSIRRH